MPGGPGGGPGGPGGHGGGPHGGGGPRGGMGGPGMGGPRMGGPGGPPPPRHHFGWGYRRYGYGPGCGGCLWAFIIPVIVVGGIAGITSLIF